MKINTPAGNDCFCVFPKPTEKELAVIPGRRPDTAIRVRVEPGMDGYVRLEHLHHSHDLGWYVQKSFCIPGELLEELVPQLRKAECMMPGVRNRNQDGPFTFPAAS